MTPLTLYKVLSEWRRKRNEIKNFKVNEMVIWTENLRDTFSALFAIEYEAKWGEGEKKT